jgi:hypothetical protein
MISWLKKLLFIFIMTMAGLWVFTQVPFGQRFVKEKIEQALSRPSLDISIQHVDIVLPFFIRLNNICATDPLHNHTTLFTCQSLVCSPLFLDISFGQLTLLQVQGRGLFIDADAIERFVQKSSTSETSGSLPFALKIPVFRFKSVHVKSQRIHSAEKALDCSIRGHLVCSSDQKSGKLFLSISKSTPCFWPKKVQFWLSKNQNEYTLKSSVFLTSEGLEYPKSMLFGSSDRLDVELAASLREGASELSLRSFEKIGGTWSLSCPSSVTELTHHARLDIPPNQLSGHEYLLRRSGAARGTISYVADKELIATCDEFKTMLTLGTTAPGASDLDGSPQFQSLQFETIRTIDIQGHANGHIFSLGPDAFRFRLAVPNVAVNGIRGSFDGKIDFSLDADDLKAAAWGSGNFSSESSQLPLRLAGEAKISSQNVDAHCDLVAAAFRASVRYEAKEGEKNLWAALRCHDLSIFQPFARSPLNGTAEISSHLLLGTKHPLFSISGNVSDFLLNTVRCQSADFRFCTGTQALQNVTFTSDVTGLEYRALSVDRGHISVSLEPLTQSVRLVEARAVGHCNQLLFDLFGSGSGHTNGKNGYLAIDRIEGKVGNDTFSLERPFRLEHVGFRLSSLSGTFALGQEGRICGQWQRLTQVQANGDLSFEKVPLQHIAAGLGWVEMVGTIDGMCHYQSTSSTATATAQAQANISHFGIIGGPYGGIALGVSLSLEDENVKLESCMAGMGIKEPLMVALSIPVERITRSPWITLSPLSPLHGTIKGDIHLSQLLAGWVSGDAGFEAIIGCDVTVGGTVEKPSFQGPVHVREGRIDLLPTGEVLSDIQMDGNLEDYTLSIYHLTATDDKNGEVCGTGIVEITEDNRFRWQADLECSNVEVVCLDYANVTADAELKLTGDLSSITIAGSGRAKKALIDLAARFPSTIPEIEVTYRNENVQKDTPYKVFLNLSIDGEKCVEIKGRGLSSDWDGHLHLGGEARSLHIEGILQCLKGSFTLSTKELTISEGTVECSGNLFKDSRMNIIANISLPTIMAQVSLRGSLEAPKIAIQSTPPKPDNEILSLILFNKELGDISPLQSLQLANTAMTLQQSSGPFDLLDKVKETLGIDLIDFGSSTPGVPSTSSSTSSTIDQSDSSPPPSNVQNDVSLKVGKYLSEGVAVTVSKDVTSDANYLGLEAQIAPEVTAEAEIGDDQEGIVSLKWKKNY